ncbi:AzlD domain-containing protein [Desulfopila sp. IMCC35006]|uniref:AzlD domain-containing protein n=1 Tax=Desulfopila sp. IMCC35006 TaxID=2569542 RepID=UPI00197AB9CF|nr:AzlD domain-containing protein [Desulfopila sp. IMCC35006]
MDQTLIFWTVVGMAVVTYLPRLLPTLFLSGRNLQPLISSWLRLVPPAVLAAMLVPSLLVREESVTLGFDNLFFWAALVAFPVAWKWNSLFATVIVGMGLVALGRSLGLGM